MTYQQLQQTEQYKNSPEFFDWMLDQLIQPLHQKGFELTRYNEDSDPETAMGVHTFTFELTKDKPGREPITTQFLDNLMFQDDSQPKSVYQYYFGTLWVFIPYGG